MCLRVILHASGTGNTRPNAEYSLAGDTHLLVQFIFPNGMQ